MTTASLWIRSCMIVLTTKMIHNHMHKIYGQYNQKMSVQGCMHGFVYSSNAKYFLAGKKYLDICQD